MSTGEKADQICRNCRNNKLDQPDSFFYFAGAAFYLINLNLTLTAAEI